MVSGNKVSEGIDCILLLFLCFSDIFEQTQLVEKELIRTLQSLVDVRLITMTEVRCTVFLYPLKITSLAKVPGAHALGGLKRGKLRDKVQKVSHKRSFSRFGVRRWNEIPRRIRDLPKKEFKGEIRRLLNILVNENVCFETLIVVQKIGLAN